MTSTYMGSYREQHVVVMEPRKEVVSTTMQYAPKVGNWSDTIQNRIFLECGKHWERYSEKWAS